MCQSCFSPGLYHQKTSLLLITPALCPRTASACQPGEGEEENLPELGCSLGLELWFGHSRCPLKLQGDAKLCP